MRILCLVTDGFGGQGGIAQHCRHLLSALCGASHVDSVHALPRVAPVYKEILPQNLHYVDESAKSVIGYATALSQATMLCGRWDLVVSEHINLAFPSACIAALHRARFLLVAHGYESWSAPGRFNRWALRRANRILCVSATTKERFQAWSEFPDSKFSVIHNAVDLKQFTPGPRPEYLQERYGLSDEPLIMTLGRLSEEEQSKGFDRVISILPALLKSQPRLRYLIAGEGKDQGRLEALSRSLNLEEHVIFSGAISVAEKVDHYRLADAFVMPSRLEGFGYVFIEALACGLPVVGSQLDGGRDALLGGALGDLVDPNDSVALCDAILRSLEKPKKIQAQLRHFSLERFNREINALTEEIL